MKKCQCGALFAYITHFLIVCHNTSNNVIILFISIYFVYFLITGNWCIFFFSFEGVQFFLNCEMRVLSSVILSLKSFESPASSL